MVLSKTELEGHVDDDDDDLDDIMYSSFKCCLNIISVPFSCEIRGSHSAGCEDCSLLGCNPVSSPFAFEKYESATFSKF
jgi:hypothetical protein